MKNCLDVNLTQAICDGRFLVNVTNLISYPIRTGIQRVCYEFWQRWSHLETSIPFVEIDKDTIGLLDPVILDDIRNLFESKDSILEIFMKRNPEAKMEPNSGWLGLVSARNRIVANVKVKPALDACRGVVALEESLNINFFSEAAEHHPDKILHLCHDFLIWTHSEFFNIDWNSADNISESLVNRRKYKNNFFTSTMTRDVYVNKINPQDVRDYWVIPPGADAFGRSYRTEIPKSNEFVVVGTLEPRKQPVQILEAFESINKNGVKAELCFAGRMGWLKPADKEKLQKAFRTYPWVRWVDGPDDGELRALMQSARASIYMSVAEGFGSPPVESLALGVPCIVSDTVPSVVDMQSNGQRRVSPHDKAGLIAAINDLLDDAVLFELQREIETLELPTWRAFVEGIRQMADERLPAKPGALEPTKYRDMLAVLEVCKQFRELPRDTLIRRLLAIGQLNSEKADELIEDGKAKKWNNIDTILNLSQILGSDVFKVEFASAAISDSIHFADLPLSDESTWKAAFDRLVSERDHKRFVERVYVEMHGRDGKKDEILGKLPYEARDFSYLSIIMSAFYSEEFDRFLVKKVFEGEDSEYFDRIEIKSKENMIHYFKSLYARFEIDSSLFISDNDEFVERLYSRLTGQFINRKDLRRLARKAQFLTGRYEVALEIMLSRACVMRALDARVHHDLITDMARRSGYYNAPKANEIELAGRIQVARSGPLTTMDILKTITARPYGYFSYEVVQALDDLSTPDAKIAVAVVWSMLSGYADWSVKLLSWAKMHAGSEPLWEQASHKRIHKNASAAFAEFYGRYADQVELSILADNAALVNPVLCALVASIRSEQNPDIMGAVNYIIVNKDIFESKANELESAVQELLDICAPPKNYQLKPYLKGEPHHNANNSDNIFAENVLGDMTSVEELMKLNGEAFISAAYRRILLRDADDAGMANYLKAMSTSRGKPGVIYSLATSEEGRSKNVNLRGLEQLLRDYKPKPKKKKFGLKKVIRFFSSKGSKVGN